MTTGTVKKWFDAKGYGFLVPDDGGQDVFVHISAVELAGLTIDVGDKVSFDIAPSRMAGRFEAKNLRAA